MTGDEGQGPGSDAGPLSLSPEGATATSRAIASGRHRAGCGNIRGRVGL